MSKSQNESYNNNGITKHKHKLVKHYFTTTLLVLNLNSLELNRLCGARRIREQREKSRERFVKDLALSLSLLFLGEQEGKNCSMIERIGKRFPFLLLFNKKKQQTTSLGSQIRWSSPNFSMSTSSSSSIACEFNLNEGQREKKI